MEHTVIPLSSWTHWVGQTLCNTSHLKLTIWLVKVQSLREQWCKLTVPAASSFSTPGICQNCPWIEKFKATDLNNKKKNIINIFNVTASLPVHDKARSWRSVSRFLHPASSKIAYPIRVLWLPFESLIVKCYHQFTFVNCQFASASQ